MTATDERHELGKLAEVGGWRRRDVDRVDVYQRDVNRVRVIWQGPSAISGASLYQDDIMTTYTRELSAVQAWLKR